MRHALFLTASSTLALAAIALPLHAQDDQTSTALPIANLTCDQIAKVPAAYQAALIYYAAGYREGLDYARAELTVPLPASSSMPVTGAPSTPSSSSEQSSSPASASSSSAEQTTDGAPVVAGLKLQSEDIVTACAAAPHAFLTDVIRDRGGARGLIGVTSPAPQTIIASSAPAPEATGATGATPPASSAVSQPPATENSGAAAVSSDLSTASEQFQQNTTAPATGAGTGAATTSP